MLNSLCNNYHLYWIYGCETRQIQFGALSNLRNFFLQQASSTTQVLVQWDSCIEKKRVAANDSQPTCYHTGNKKIARGLYLVQQGNRYQCY